jgi:prepilin-type N-terminal cleavage/methylation domain-containing protein
MNEKGFHLIELIIVLAILLIIAAIAIPNLLTARALENFPKDFEGIPVPHSQAECKPLEPAITVRIVALRNAANNAPDEKSTREAQDRLKRAQSSAYVLCGNPF